MYNFKADGSYTEEIATLTIQNATVSNNQLMPSSDSDTIIFNYSCAGKTYSERRPIYSINKDKDLDLVVVSQNQEPPVCKIMDYGKYRYELEKRAKEAKKKQHTVDIKEIKVRYKIDTHDYLVRINNIKKFIAQGNKVKVLFS